MKIVAIIPARSGSKRIKNKNTRLYAGRPLVFWSIDLALKSNYIEEIIITSDSYEIHDLIKFNYNNSKIKYLLRPEDISGDLSTDYEFIEHYLKNTSDQPDLIVQLRPTYPNRRLEDLNNTIRIMINNYDSYDSLRTIVPSKYTPYKMYKIQDNNLTPLFTSVNNIEEPYNMPAQILPMTYIHNGYIDIIKSTTFNNKKSITGDNIYPYIMDARDIHDIDTEEDWIISEKIFKSLTYMQENIADYYY